MEESPWSNVYIIMTKDLFQDKNLTLSEKIIMAYVRGFEMNGKLCFASSEHMADLFCLNQTYIRRIRGQLVDKGYLLRKQKNGQTYFESVLQNVTPTIENVTGVLQNVTGGVTNCNGGVLQNVTPGVTKCNTYNKDIDLVDNTSDKKVYKPTHSDSRIEKHLKSAFDSPSGKLAWEKSNAWMIARRRPLKNYPLVWMTDSELALALEELQKYNLSPKELFTKLNQRIEQKTLEGKKADTLSGYQYFGYVLNEILEVEIKTERLRRVRNEE